jgi:hypothetical protein
LRPSWKQFSATSRYQKSQDLSKLIAWKFKIASSFAEKFLTLALTVEKEAILAQPNICQASAWLK